MHTELLGLGKAALTPGSIQTAFHLRFLRHQPAAGDLKFNGLRSQDTCSDELHDCTCCIGFHASRVPEGQECRIRSVIL